MSRLEKIITAIDTINIEDPNLENEGDQQCPKEWLYGRRMSAMLREYETDSTEVIQIAARGQHIKRWIIPRADYPMNRVGYLTWRNEVKKMHGEMLMLLMKTEGYSDNDIADVVSMVTKSKLKNDSGSKKLQDVVCLVFLKYYFSDFAANHETDKIISILRKTWGKMTSKGHKMAMILPFKAKEAALISQALEEE